MKYKIIIFLTCISFFIGGIGLGINFSKKKLPKLPKPEATDGFRGSMGIDKNINEETIDNYLFREDSVYRDMRMLVDPADYEAIDGDSYLSGTIEGFEAIPFPLLFNVTGLPEEIGENYKGTTLFIHTEDDKYIPNFVELMEYMEYYFPKDKNIFLLCGGGGYSGMTKDMLVSLGWDRDKIYVVGGHWFYEGDYNVQIKKEYNGKPSYDFWKVTLHDIDFDHFNKIK